MEEKQQQIFTANKLATTVGAISFIEKEIMTQSNVDLIGFEVDMLVVEIDQQKYEEFISFESGNLNETRHYHRVRSNTRGMGKKVFTEKWRSLEIATIESLFGQEILAEDEFPAAEENLETGLTRTQLRNRNRRARQKALKTRLRREANGSEAIVPRKLARANRETGYYRVKREVTTCLKSKKKPACDIPREAIAELSEKREASEICASRKISDTCEKCE